MTLTKEAALEWLSLVESSGLYLAPKVLEAAFPQSLDSVDTGKRQRLRSAWDEWREAVDGHDPQLKELHREWIRMVLTELLEYRDTILRPVEAGNEEWTYITYDTGTVVKPDWVLRTQSDKPKAAVFVYPPDRSLDRAGKNAISPIEQVTAWCRARGVRNALLTDGERWTLLDAPEGAVSGNITWYARLWWLEPVTLRAFYSLLRARNLFGAQQSTFPQLVDDSQEYRDEVTTTLGEQVERAVEVLVRALDRANRDKNGKLLEGVGERELYEAGLTVMMRLVFILSAEERGLLLLGDPVWDANYAVSTLRSQLEEMDDRDGHGVLQLRFDAWNRLLAVFRALYGGIAHESLRLPALGGSLFDPDRFPFLEGRPVGSSWRDPDAKPEPLPIDNRTVLLLLNALQKLAKRDGAQTLSYRALDVEQIGHVYEGLLERTVSRVADVTLGLEGSAKKKSPDVLLTRLESALWDGRDRLIAVVREATERSESAIRRDLDKEVTPERQRALSQACDGDAELVKAILPFANLLRTDPWDEPVVYRKDAFAVTSGSDRKETGTHYTPKALTERIVGTTLEPVAYVGPAEGLPREEWKLKSAAQLLELKICDPAMGSGAFLVQTCRWLAEKVVQAWAHAEEQGQAVSAEGEVLTDLAGHDPLPADPEERLTLARRLVAERCLYGVDINPVAVELAKLSIWLVTLAKNRPFGFLDHNLRHGDSLLGIRDLEQLTSLSMTPKPGDHQYIFATNIREAVDEAVNLRQRLRAIPLRDIRDVQQMAKLAEQARRILERPELAADALIGEAMRHAGKPGDLSVALRVASTEIGKMMSGDVEGEKAVAKRAREALSTDISYGLVPRKPVHWPLYFPEVFDRQHPGFDSFIGNPPFVSGKRISSTFSYAYQEYLKGNFEGSKGAADLSVFFLRRGFDLIRNAGTQGMITTKAAAEGESRIVGLLHILNSGGIIYDAVRELEWPGKASVVISQIFLAKGIWQGKVALNGKTAITIDSNLREFIAKDAIKLDANKGLCSDGIKIMGDGFILQKSEANFIIQNDSKYSDVIKPYLTGKDIVQSFGSEPTQMIISFGTMSYDQASTYDIALKILEDRVKPYRDSLTGQIHEYDFWKFWDKREEFFSRARQSPNYLVCPSTSKYLVFGFVDSSIIPAESVKVFALSSFSGFSLLQSIVHESWAREKSGKLGDTLAYNTTRAFSTFPFPDDLPEASVGEEFYRIRRDASIELGLGMTDLYNEVHRISNRDSKINMIREMQIELDAAALKSYGWTDIFPNYDFREAAYLSSDNRIRFSIDDSSRIEIIRRLSDLNIQKAQQLPSKAKPKAAKAPKPASAKAPAPPSLFDAPPAAGLMPEKPRQAVLDVLRRGNRWFKKAEVLRESGVTEGEWNLVIVGLVEDGTVERRGEKRGTEYMLKR